MPMNFESNLDLVRIKVIIDDPDHFSLPPDVKRVFEIDCFSKFEKY
jgi:hypothetical protein